MRKINFNVLACVFFLAFIPGAKAGTATNEWFSLFGVPLPAGNMAGKDGLVHRIETPTLRVMRSAAMKPGGTVLLFPGGGYQVLDLVNEGQRTAQKLNDFGFDVVLLEYQIASGPKTRDCALTNALDAWRFLKAHPDILGIHSQRSVVMGYSAGGHLAARMVQAISDSAETQPDDLVLVYPAYLDETADLLRKIQPPVRPTSRLFVIMTTNDRPAWITGAHEYVNSWLKAGGYAVFQSFADGSHGFGMAPDLKGDLAQWPQVLNYFLEKGPAPGVGPFNTVLPWFVGHEQDRKASFQKHAPDDQGAIVFLGDSITEKWDVSAAFPKLKVANRGIAGDTTRGMLARLDDSVLNLHPKAVVFLGGINDLSCQPRGTPETIAANLNAILLQIHKTAPATPVLILETLPSKGAPATTVQAINAAVKKVVADFANAHQISSYEAFLKPDGSENLSLYLDGTHPNQNGYAILEKRLNPELHKYMDENKKM